MPINNVLPITTIDEWVVITNAIVDQVNLVGGATSVAPAADSIPLSDGTSKLDIGWIDLTEITTIGATISNAVTFSSNITITGDLTVNGSTTTINTTNTTIEDNVIILNNGETGPGVTLGTAGIEIDRGDGVTVGQIPARFLFDESNDSWSVNDLDSPATLHKIWTEDNYLEGSLKVTASDTTPAELSSKIATTAGYGIKTSINSPGGNETLQVQLGEHYISALSSGLFSGGAISAGTVGTINIAAGEGFTNDSSSFPTVAPVPVTISSRTNLALTDILTQPVTYIMITPADAVLQLGSFPTNEQKRDNIFLGVAVHSDNTTVNAVNNIPDVGMDIAAQVHDIMLALGFFNQSGNVISADPGSPADLSFNKSVGTAFKAGANFQNNSKDPHSLSLPSQTNATFRYRSYFDSSEGSDITLIDPLTYDDGTATPNVFAGSNNQATIQRIYIFPSGILRVQRGQEVFTTLGDAIDAVGKEAFITETNIDENGLLLASLAVTKGCTDLSVTTEAQFFQASRFGELGSVGSSASTDLQNAYDNSITPEILTDTTRGALSVKRGSAADTDVVLEVLDNSDGINFSVTGEGDVTMKDSIVTGFKGGSSTLSITAAGTTEGAATALTTEINIVTVVASAADSVKLPTAVQGRSVLVKNDDQASPFVTLNVFPLSGDLIEGVSTATSIAAGASQRFTAYDDTNWIAE